MEKIGSKINKFSSYKNQAYELLRLVDGRCIDNYLRGCKMIFCTKSLFLHPYEKNHRIQKAFRG
jgi:hypothetical protein